MKSIIRTIIIIAIVGGLGYVGYKYYMGRSADTSPTGLQTTTSDGTVTSGEVATSSKSDGVSMSVVGQDFLALLLNVESIKLDDSIFSSRAFTLLQDFNRPIPPDTNPGRPNPFANLGVDSAAVSSQISTSSTSSITTTTSTLNGTMAVGGPGVTRWFEYGTTSALGTTTTPKPQDTPGAFSETISGLNPNTTYYVKTAASIGGIIVGGNLITWKTAEGGTQQSPGKTPAKPTP